VRFYGSIVPSQTGYYKFATNSDDGVMLWWRNGSIWAPLINDPYAYLGIKIRDDELFLNAGQSYPIVLDYYEVSGNANIQLRWIPPGSTVTTVIPQANLSVNFPVTTPAITLPPPGQDGNCALDQRITLITQSQYNALPASVKQELTDMGIANSEGLVMLGGPALNAQSAFSTRRVIRWGDLIRAGEKISFPQTPGTNQHWYLAYDQVIPGAGWIPIRYEGVNFTAVTAPATQNPCAANTTVTLPTSLTFTYDRRAAANYAIEHSWRNNSLSNPIAENRVTRRLGDNNQSGTFIPFANFVYSNLSGASGATGSAMFISEAIWAGGLPMTVGSTNNCDSVAIANAGWCYQWANTTGNPSNPWDLHEQLVAYYTLSLAPDTVLGFNVANDRLSNSYQAVRLSFTGTMNPNYLSGGRTAPDNLFNPDPPNTTDFNNFIPSLRQGFVLDPTGLDAFINLRLSNIRMGDYILIDLVNTGQSAHGMLVVGWGPIEDCDLSLTTRRTINNFSPVRLAGSVPYVADFARQPSPTPKPFYCSMYNDQIAPNIGLFNRHNWYFYPILLDSLQSELIVNRTRIYADLTWQWDANSGQ
jgi:hypothetical protein